MKTESELAFTDRQAQHNARVFKGEITDGQADDVYSRLFVGENSKCVTVVALTPCAQIAAQGSSGPDVCAGESKFVRSAQGLLFGDRSN